MVEETKAADEPKKARKEGPKRSAKGAEMTALVDKCIALCANLKDNETFPAKDLMKAEKISFKLAAEAFGRAQMIMKRPIYFDYDAKKTIEKHDCPIVNPLGSIILGPGYVTALNEKIPNPSLHFKPNDKLEIELTPENHIILKRMT